MSVPLRFLLASASPRRTELLRAAGIPHAIEVAAVTEHEDPRTDPCEMVLHNARLKAAAVARLHPDALVLGADTTVALGDRALNKPADLAESRAMLRSLSGREHTVHTGVCLLCPALGIDEHAQRVKHQQELSVGQLHCAQSVDWVEGQKAKNL